MARKKVLVANVRGPQGPIGPQGPVGDVTPEASRLAEEVRTIYRNVQFTSDAFDYKVTQVTQDLDNKSAQEQEKLTSKGQTIADNLVALGTQYESQLNIKLQTATQALDTKEQEINKNLNDKQTEIIGSLDTKGQELNTNVDKIISQAYTNLNGKLNETSIALDEKSQQVKEDLDTKSQQVTTAFEEKVNLANSSFDTKVNQANQSIDANVAQAQTYAEQAETSATNAKSSETNAKASETNAKQSELDAKASADSIGGLVDAFKIDTSEQGRIVVANDSTERTINGLKVYGESTQVQSTGANLLDPDAIAKINVNGEMNGLELALEEGQYTVSINDANNPGQYIYLRIRKANSELTSIKHLITPQTVMPSYTLTLEKGDVILIYDASTINSIELTKSIFKSFKIMVNKGAKALPFEPYTGGKVVPSSESPQEIISKVVNSITLYGKNLVNIPPITVDTLQTSIDCNLIGTVVVNAEITNNNNNNIWRINLRRKDGTSVNITDNDLKDKVMTKLKVIATFQNPIVSITYRGNNIVGSGYDRIMVAYGDTIQPYEPYKEPQVVTLSQPVTLYGVRPKHNAEANVTIDGNLYLSDIIMKKDDVYGVERRLYTTTTTTTTTFVSTYDGKKGFYIGNVLKEVADRNGGLCNIAKTDYGSVSGDNLCWIGAGNKNIYLLNNSLWDESLPDKGLQNIKDFLKENPLTVVTYYSKPTFEPLPEADQQALKALKSNYPTTVVVNNDNAFMQLDYVADTKNYIDNRLSEIKTALIASKGV